MVVSILTGNCQKLHYSCQSLQISIIGIKLLPSSKAKASHPCSTACTSPMTTPVRCLRLIVRPYRLLGLQFHCQLHRLPKSCLFGIPSFCCFNSSLFLLYVCPVQGPGAFYLFLGPRLDPVTRPKFFDPMGVLFNHPEFHNLSFKIIQLFLNHSTRMRGHGQL